MDGSIKAAETATVGMDPATPAIAAAFEDLDKAIAELADARDFAADRAERLVGKIDPVLDPRSSPVPIEDDVAQPERVTGYVASRIYDRAGQVRTLFDRVRTLGRHLDTVGDRVEL